MVSAKDKLTDMERILNDQNQKNLTGSLEQCKDELRDAYMNFKDLSQRCVIDINKQASFGEDDDTVYYFKPETFLLDDPEK